MSLPIKKTFICKDIIDYKIDKEIPANYSPKVGDVAIFEIIKLGKHRNVQSEFHRNMKIIPGDLMMASFGNRYATAQFEGYVPSNVNGELHILGAGGVIGIVKSSHYDYIEIGPTIVKIIGLVRDSNETILNTKKIKSDLLKKFSGLSSVNSKVILSLGSSMDSGKSTTASYFVNGIMRSGHKVAFIKLTGTAYTKDSDLNADLGAIVISDFSEFGFPSTYMCDENELLNLYESLVTKVCKVNPDYIVIEIADGIYQRETDFLIKNSAFMKTVYAIVFSAGDSLSAIHGINLLKNIGIEPVALSGLFTASPLLIKEVNERKNFDLPVVTLDEISSNAMAILDRKF